MVLWGQSSLIAFGLWWNINATKGGLILMNEAYMDELQAKMEREGLSAHPFFCSGLGGVCMHQGCNECHRTKGTVKP